MPYSYVIDTFAWVEYLDGTRRGAAAKEYIESGRAATPTVVILELSRWFLKEIEEGRRTLEEMNVSLQFVTTSTLTIDMDIGLARKAGETHFLMKKRIRDWPMADSIVCTTATIEGAQVVSGDPHFKQVENTILI